MVLHELTIHQASRLLRDRSVSSVELTRAVLDRIQHVEERVRAYLNVSADLALAAADDADRRRVQGEDHPLLGVPLAFSDALCTRDVESTCASRILKGFTPSYDATIVAKLRQAGIVPLGKTNLDEFAIGSTTELSAYHATHNPWLFERTPGGSSGGSAAAVAAAECFGALGTDADGGIRRPASFCGVVGLKPTYGRASRYGVIGAAPSLDQVGLLAKDVEDGALLLQAIAGHDPCDSTSSERTVPDYLSALRPDVAGIRLGLPVEYLSGEVQPEVKEAVLAALDIWRSLGAEFVEVSMPHTEYVLPALYLISCAEASSSLARYDGIRFGLSVEGEDIWDAYRRTRGEGLGSEVKRRIVLGTHVLSAGHYDAYFVKAQKARTLIKQDFDRAFAACDALITPTTPTTAFDLGEKVDDPLEMYLADDYTPALNLAGGCGISIPCGFTGGLPIGLQVLGDAFKEETVLRVAYAYEQATEWRLRKPSL